ncbi:VWA domain-containing protein [Planctomicrobium piriforme]|uniref:Uncharacterized membrane protein n=1 Tax=Planctomicrobium piriforme TaxID=1576369 RepID=A0A1I3R703_9PLAN|nr:VWA domain-containing protein [Planctomicrobium piriforme]SFJ41439.1 Uncharacterized membrane protein [Planctomicrobium piriforme]
MTAQQSLTFVTDPGSVLLSIGIVATAIGVSVYAWRRSGYQFTFGLQELLRVAIIASAAILFNQPEWVEEYRPDERPAVAVIWDQSASMETLDVLNPGSQSTQTPGEVHSATGSGRAISRAASIESVTRPEAWSKLNEKLNVIVQPLATPVGGEGTDLFTSLSEAPNRVKNLLGVVLISDGDWNAGKPPVEAAAQLRMKGIPVFTIAAGSPSKLPDIDLVNVDLPTFGIAGKVLRIPFTIESSLPREFLTTVTLKTSDDETLTKDVRIGAMGRTSDSIAWKPANTGDYRLTLEVPRHADESIVENNTRTAPIAIRQEKLRVLIVESTPRWEYRYLRNALSRDPGVEVACLLFHPHLEHAGGGSKDYIKAFPAGIEELSKFDVVFLGDVGMEPGQLTAEQCRLLKGLVEHQASGLVFIPGGQGRQTTLLETELGELCPAILDPAQPRGWGSRTPAPFELTEKGRTSLLTKLADTQEENARVWEDLPGFQWHAAVTRAKPGSEVLAVHADATNEYGRLPLLITRTFGAGKVLFMGTDGAWRWRKGVEDKYHYRFWGQVVRWMAYQRNMTKHETMRLYYTPDQPKIRQTMMLHAHVMERSGEPLSKGEVLAVITAPSGKKETVRLQAEGEEWGVFQGRYVPEEHGQFQLEVVSKQTSATLETQFYVQGEALEQRGKPARPQVLEEISRVTHGQSTTARDVDQIINSLAALPLPPPAVRRVQLWSHPLAAGLLILLLGAFWVWRKTTGLI